MNSLKADGLLFLRYSASKQRELRERYYDFVVEKSRVLATVCLKDWQAKAFQN
jgi:hypothetical protein